MDQVIVDACFPYEAEVIPKRHRNSWRQTFRGVAPIALDRVAEGDAPLALRVSRDVASTEKGQPPSRRVTSYRWDGERFLIGLPGPDGRPMSVDAFARAMGGEGMSDGRSDVQWMGNPLLTYEKGHEQKIRPQALFHLATREGRADEIRTWVGDKLQEGLAKLHSRARSVVVVGDVVHKVVAEPAWEMNLRWSRCELGILRAAPEPDGDRVRFRLDRKAEAEEVARRLGRQPEGNDAAEILLPESLAFDDLACNAASLFEKVVPELGSKAVRLATGEAARAWADVRDAEAAWLAGDAESLPRAYAALRRLADADWTKAPRSKDYGQPSPEAALPFLAAFEGFERARLEDEAALDGLDAPRP